MVDVSRVPLTASVDLALGGRWASISGGGREWLWFRHDPARAAVRPGDHFVDSGGLEECIPTVRGTPDHGEAWSHPWRRDDGDDVVDCQDFVLRRGIRHVAGSIVASYRLVADAGYRFLWAGHALLDVSESARLDAPVGVQTLVYSEAAGLLADAWPPGATTMVGTWPEPLGLPLWRLGPTDGTAIGAILGCTDVRVLDGRDRLRIRLEVDNQPSGTALWRNLGGFPPGAPYRSVGVEPMLGSAFNLAEAAPHQTARVPASGEVSWRLIISAERTYR